MTRFGFIGTGSMGSMLITRFIAAGRIAPLAIAASSKTGVSARTLAGTTGIFAVAGNRAVAEHADILFLCVKPLQVRGVLEEVRDVVRPGTLLVSIAACVSLDTLRDWAGEEVRVVRVIPSVTAEQDAGISLIAWGRSVRPEDKALLLDLLNAIGTAVETEEKDFDICTDLTSCGPALIVSMVQEFSRAAARTGKLSPATAEFLARETLIGTAKILAAEKITFDEIIARVATKGGSTEEGVKEIRAQLPEVADEILRALDAKRHLVAEKIAREK